MISSPIKSLKCLPVAVPILWVSLLLYACSSEPPQLDTFHYPADDAKIPSGEGKNTTLKKKKNCQNESDGDWGLYTWSTVCDDINPYIYYTEEEKTYNGPIEISYFSEYLDCGFKCTGEIKDGIKFGNWHMVSSQKDIEIDGSFGSYRNGFRSFCTGKWNIRNRRDSIFYEITFTDKQDTLELKKWKLVGKDSILIRQTISNFDRSINVSPFMDFAGDGLNFTAEPDFADQTRITCIFNSATRSMRYESHDFTLETWNDKLLSMKYYADTLGYVTLLYDSNRHYLSQVVLSQNDEEKKFTGSKKTHLPSDFIRYQENGEKEHLKRTQFWRYDPDSLLEAVQLYCR